MKIGIFTIILAFCAVIPCLTSVVSGDELTTGMRVGQKSGTLPGGEQELLQLTLQNGKPALAGTDYTWTESVVEPYVTSSQGYLDAVTGADGHLYCAFYDDRTWPGNPNHRAVYVRKSTDGGSTWQNIDSGATGFALAYLGGAGGELGPSIAVFETTPGVFRIAVAVYAGNASLTYYTPIVLWKNLGSTDDWTDVYLTTSSFDFALPKLVAIPRPGAPSRTRLVVSYGCLDPSYFGFIVCKYSDTDGTSFVTTGAFISDILAYEFWKADFTYDSVNNRLFCVWSMSEDSDPAHLPRVMTALSTNSGAAWFTDIFAISPSGWNLCAEARCAVTGNPLIPDRTLMVVYSAQQYSTSTFGVRYTYQFLDTIQVSGTTWSMSPPGHPVITGLVYTDTDSDNTMPSIVADNRLTGGGYRVVLLDETSVSSSRMLYTETGFEAPFTWMTPEVASAPGADPARQGTSTGVSSAVAVGAGAWVDRRYAFWPDYRSITYSDIYCARADGEPPVATPTPTVTPTPEPTSTPTGGLTPVPTSTPRPIPAMGPSGTMGLLLMLGILMIVPVFRRRN